MEVLLCLHKYFFKERTKTMKFIHAADLHLDTPFAGLSNLPYDLFERMKSATFDAFDRLIDETIAYSVDALIIAGDIYDLESQSVKAQLAFQNGMERLAEAGIKAFVSHGNHDHLTPTSKAMAYPENVHVFSPKGETVDFVTRDGESVAISGFSYDKRWIDVNRLKNYPIKSKSHQYHIGMLHGDQYKSSTPNHYAPYTLDDIKNLHYNYLALGHIHVRKTVLDSPKAYYSGSLQGLSSKETGPKGYLMVELDNTKVHVNFHELSPIVWENKYVDISGVQQVSEIATKIEALFATYTDDNIILLSVTLKHASKLDQTIVESIQSGELREALESRYEKTGVYLYRVDLADVERPVIDDLYQQFPKAFEKSLGHLFEKDQFKKLTDELFIEQKTVRNTFERDKAYIAKMKRTLGNTDKREEDSHDN